MAFLPKATGPAGVPEKLGGGGLKTGPAPGTGTGVTSQTRAFKPVESDLGSKFRSFGVGVRQPRKF